MTSARTTKDSHQITEVLDFIGYDEELLSNEVLTSIFSFISLVPGRTDIGVGMLVGTDAKIVGWHARKLIENKLVEYDKDFSAYFEHGIFDREEKQILNLASKGSSYYIFKHLIERGFIDTAQIKNYTRATIERRLEKLLDMDIIEENTEGKYIISDHGKRIIESIKNKQSSFNITLLMRLRLEKIEVNTIIKDNEIIVSPSIGYPFILSVDPAKTLIKYGEP